MLSVLSPSQVACCSPPLALRGEWPRAQAISGASLSHSVSAQTPDLPVSIAPQPAIAAPTLSEMRSMTAEQLDEEGDRLRQGKDYLSAIDCYRAAIRKHSSAGYYNNCHLRVAAPPSGGGGKGSQESGAQRQAHGRCLNNLAVSYYLRTTSPHHLDDAIRTYQRAISLKPTAPRFTTTCGGFHG